MLEILLDEAKKIARDPGRLREALRPRRWRQFFSILRFNARAGNRWKAAADSNGLKQRQYSSYAEYVRHQQSKFGYLDLTEYDRIYREQLRERLRDQPFVKRGASILCLGARQGTEVRAFQDLGCFAVGLDLNPGPNNRWVLPGDFHEVPFPDQSVDVIFTNSFDHAFDPQKLIAEIRRLLKNDGVLILEAMQGEAENVSPDYYASFWWRSIDDLIALLEGQGFAPIRRLAIQKPWPGQQVCFKLGKKEIRATDAKVVGMGNPA
jgi:SAM-dependent methyltransferase